MGVEIAFHFDATTRVAFHSFTDLSSVRIGNREVAR